MTLLPEVETALLDAVRRHQHLPIGTSPARQSASGPIRASAKRSRVDDVVSSDRGVRSLRARRLLIGLSAALPVVLVAAVFLMQSRATHTGGSDTVKPNPGEPISASAGVPGPGPATQTTRPVASALGELADAPRSPARPVGLQQRTAPDVAGPAGGNELCLLGTRGLGSGCAPTAFVLQRGLLSFDSASSGALQAQGILPVGATLKVHYADHTRSEIHTNADRAFALRLPQPAVSFTLTPRSSKAIFISGKCLPCKHRRSARQH